MPSRPPWLFVWFPALLCFPLAAQRLSPVDRQLVAAGIWAEARYNYAYWDAVRANWDSAFAAAVTYVGASPRPTDLQFFRRLRRWGALLDDGQLEILPPGTIAGRVARPPLILRSIEHRPFIMDYAINDEMRVARPERLAEILAVQGIPAATWIRDSVLPEIPAATEASRWERAVAAMLEGERGTAVHLLLRLPGGAERGASVTRSVPLTARSVLARPPAALEADTLADGAIWIRVNSFADPAVVALFDRALGDAPREGPRHRGLILDLRETTWTAGGREQGYAMLSRLIDRPVLTSRWRPPQYRHAYRGPVAVLSSSRTAGPAEDLLVAFRNSGRGSIIGETSAGSTGQTAVLKLAGEWQLRVTVTRDAFPDGTEFMRTGIAPEIPVEVRVEDVLAGQDAVLDRAREYLAA